MWDARGAWMSGAEMTTIDYLFQLFVSAVCGVTGWGIGQAWRFRDFRKELIRNAGTGLPIEVDGRMFFVSEVKNQEENQNEN
jgi:hypothetical protein